MVQFQIYDILACNRSHIVAELQNLGIQNDRITEHATIAEFHAHALIPHA